MKLLKDNISEYKVSVFECGYKSKYPIYETTISDWLSMCSKDTKSLQARNEFIENGKTEKYKEYKNKLKCATLSGTFDYRTKDTCKCNNGLLAIDIDHPVMELEELKQILIENFGPYIYSIALSVSGDGYYVLVLIDTNKDRQLIFNYIKRKFNDLDIEIDVACTDVSRLRYMSYDANPWFNPNEYIEVFDTELEINELDDIVYQNQFQYNKEKYEKTSLLASDKFCYLAAWNCINMFSFKVCGYTDWFSAISPLTTLPYDKGLNLAIILSMNSPGYVSDADVKRKFDEIIKTNKSDREYFLRYFKYCKDRMGKNWVGQLKNFKSPKVIHVTK